MFSLCCQSLGPTGVCRRGRFLLYILGFEGKNIHYETLLQSGILLHIRCLYPAYLGVMEFCSLVYEQMVLCCKYHTPLVPLHQLILTLFLLNFFLIV